MCIIRKWTVFSSIILCALANVASIPPRDHCRIFGSVYVVDDPKQANFIIYEEETEGSADLWVYAIEEKLFADKPGLWYFTDKEAFADYRIYVTGSKYLADFSVYYIDIESFAGCND